MDLVLKDCSVEKFDGILGVKSKEWKKDIENKKAIMDLCLVFFNTEKLGQVIE